MTQYDNTNSGALFANENRKTDNHPTHTGSINADGVDYWLSAWVKEKNGKKYFSFSLKKKDQQQDNRVDASKPRDELDDFLDDEIPF